MFYWAIILENYLGEHGTFYFENECLARASFEALCDAYIGYEEFERDKDSVSWFDPSYNEYSTYAELVKAKIAINKTIITDW